MNYFFKIPNSRSGVNSFFWEYIDVKTGFSGAFNEYASSKK